MLDNIQFKKYIDNILVVNLFLIIIGSIFFISSIIMNLNGYPQALRIFQKLWFPVFIPSLSIFFTSITVELLVKQIKGLKDN